MITQTYSYFLKRFLVSCINGYADYFFYLISDKALHVYCMNKHEMKIICIYMCLYIRHQCHLCPSLSLFQKAVQCVVIHNTKVKKRKGNIMLSNIAFQFFLTNLIVTISLLLDPCFKKLNFKPLSVIQFSFHVRF